MKRIRLRSLLVLLLAGLLGLGMLIFCGLYLFRGGQWAAFSANDHVYTDGRLAVGQILDRNGTLLYDGPDGSYAESRLLRRATLHAVGDAEGNIASGARTALARRLVGFDPLTGTNGGGHRLTLSIDAQLNATALEALDGRKGAVAIYNYRTGDMLCMVSAPTYDPEDPPEIREGDSRYEGVYLNRVLSAAYTPGSVFKIVTTAAALEQLEGVRERTFTCNGRLELEGGVITCPRAHGEMDLSRALAVSCNCAYAQLAVELGGETLARYAEQAGLCESFSVSGIETSAGSFTAGEGADLGWSGVGQYQDLVNPCAFLRLMGAIASEDAVTPRLICRESSMGGLPVSVPGAGRVKSPFEQDTCRTLREMLRGNVLQTYGQNSFGDLAVCAKSGTAETGDGKAPHAWFAGFVDDETLPLAFVVVVENGGGGAEVAGSIAARLLNQAAEDME